MNAQQQFYDQFSFVHPVVMAWGEMDAFGHLNNVVYYRHAESARIVYLYQLMNFDTNKIVVLAQSSCSYFKPVTYPDTLHIGVQCTKLGTSSMVCEYHFFSEQQQAVVAIGEAVIVSLDSLGKSNPWTEQERKKILVVAKNLA